MSEAVSQTRPSRGSASQFLRGLGVRPREVTLVRLLFGNMFMSGIAIGMIRVCAFTLFLAHFASEQLAIVAILLAVFGSLLTLVLERFTRGFTTRTYLYVVLGLILGGIITVRVLLGSIDSKTLVFLLPLFFEITYLLISLQFIALLTRLFNVRQTKRLAGLARSGEFAAELVGGLSIAYLLNYMEVRDLLWVAALAIVGVFFSVRMTVRRYKRRLSLASEHTESEEQGGRMLGMLRMPYVRLITFCYSAFIFAYFFIEVAFYRYAVVQFPDQTDLASFIGQFFAISGVLTMLAMIFISAPFIRHFGILASVIAFPVVIGIGTMTVSVLEFMRADLALIFMIMIGTTSLRMVLQAAIWRPTVGILFQVLPDKQRSLGTALIEGIIDPLVGGLAGVTLYWLSQKMAWEPKMFLMMVTALMTTWLIAGFFIRSSYLKNLMVSIQKRKLGSLNINLLDQSSLDIILQGLDSPFPEEVLYCLNMLEEIEHPDINNHLQYILANKNEAVRLDVLRRIERLKIEKLSRQINLRIDEESNPKLLGQVLRTYAALNQNDVVDRLAPFLDHADKEVRKGALIGLLSEGSGIDAAQDYLLGLIRSEQQEPRILAADVIGEIGRKTYSGYLMELLEDMDNRVVDRALVAAGNVRDERLVNIMVRKLSEPALLGRAALSLQQFGEGALFDLDQELKSPTANRQVKRKIVEILREMNSRKAIDVLLNHIEMEDPELRHQVYLGLANLHYQAEPDDRHLFINMLDQEARKITWLLATMEDLFGQDNFDQIHSAISHELDVHRDNLLLLTSFIFSSIVMLDTRANIDSKIAELRVFALEVLENLLTGEVKQIVIPLLDDLSVAERLQKLSIRFPQEIKTAEERLDDILGNHFESCFTWTRACLLYHIGKFQLDGHETIARSCLEDPEPMVRETAIWTLASLAPDDIYRTLRAHADDDSPDVKRTVMALLDNLSPAS